MMLLFISRVKFDQLIFVLRFIFVKFITLLLIFGIISILASFITEFLNFHIKFLFFQMDPYLIINFAFLMLLLLNFYHLYFSVFFVIIIILILIVDKLTFMP